MDLMKMKKCLRFTQLIQDIIPKMEVYPNSGSDMNKLYEIGGRLP